MKSDSFGSQSDNRNSTGAAWNHRADRAEVTARFARPSDRPARLTDIARQDRRVEAFVYPVLCAGVLFAIGTHFAGSTAAAHQLEVALQECLRLAGLS